MAFSHIRDDVVRSGVEPPTFRFQVNRAKHYADLRKTDFTDKRNHARRKVYANRIQSTRPSGICSCASGYPAASRQASDVPGGSPTSIPAADGDLGVDLTTREAVSRAPGTLQRLAGPPIRGKNCPAPR